MVRVVWSEDEDKALIAAVASRIAVRQVDIQGRTLHSIQTRLHRLGTRSYLIGKDKAYGLRKFLKCNKTLGSEHVGNRICLPCEQADERVSSYVCALG